MVIYLKWESRYYEINTKQGKMGGGGDSNGDIIN